MLEKLPEKDNSWWKVLLLAISLPSTILGIFWVTNVLTQKHIIPSWLGLVLLLVVVSQIILIMVRYVLKNNKKN